MNDDPSAVSESKAKALAAYARIRAGVSHLTRVLDRIRDAEESARATAESLGATERELEEAYADMIRDLMKRNRSELEASEKAYGLS